MSQNCFRQSSDTVWENSDEDDTLVSDEPINHSADINDETESINDSSEEDSDTVWYAYIDKKADQLCYKLDNLIHRGLITKSGTLYKYLSDVVEIMFDPRHEYWKDVVEFINSLQYLGGRRVVNFLRGPMNINQGTRGSLQKNHLKLINFGGPSELTCNKQHAGYILCKDKKVNMFADSPQLNLLCENKLMRN